MQYQQPQPLPVHADQVYMHQMLQGQIGSPPQTPIANRVTSQNLMALHACLINGLQAGAQRSPLRTFMFNLYSANGYQNQPYAELFNSAAEYLLMVLATTPANAPQVAADTTLNCEVPLLIQQYPALLQYLNPQQQAELQNYAMMRQNVAMQLQQFYAPQQQPMQTMHPAAMMHQQSYGQPQQPMYPQQQPMGMSSYQQPYRQPMQPQRQMHPPRGQHAATGMLSTSHPQQPMQPQRGGARPKTRGSFDTTGVADQVYSNTQGEKDMRVVDQSTREMSHFVARDEQRRHEKYAPPIDKGGITFSFNRYKPARRPEQAIVSDGADNYALLDEEQAVNYKDHEDNHQMIKLAKSHHAGPKVLTSARWEDVTKPNEVDLSMKDSEEAKGVEFDDGDPIRLVQFVQAFSLPHAQVTAVDALATMGVEYDDSRVFEYYANIKTPLMVSLEDAKELEKLADSKALGTFVSTLANIADDLSPYLWNVIHDRCTALVNRRIAAGLGLDIAIDSIVTDYDDLMAALREDIADTALDRFKEHTLLMLHAATRHINDGDFECLIEPVSVTHLPWSSEELDLVLENEYSMLSVDAAPSFAAAASRILSRTTQPKVWVNRRYVVTLDNVWVELHQSDLGKDTIIISPAKGV